MNERSASSIKMEKRPVYAKEKMHKGTKKHELEKKIQKFISSSKHFDNKF